MADSVSNKVYVPDEYSYKNKKFQKKDEIAFDSNAFMKLLIEQLRNQDPLSPMDNQDFVQQTSLMAMVERLTKIETLMEESNSSLLNIREYESLIGKTATYDSTAEDDYGQVLPINKTGIITGVKMEDGKIVFQIGKDSVPRSKITGIESKGMSNDSVLDNTLKYSQMIGKTITYMDEEVVDADGNPDTTNDQTTVKKEKTAVVTGITVKDNTVQFQLDNNKTVTQSDIIGMSVKPDNLPINNNLKYAQLIGYKVTYMQTVVNEDGSKKEEERTGTVTAVSMKDGLVEFLLNDGKTKLKINQIVGFEINHNEGSSEVPEKPGTEQPTDTNGTASTENPVSP